MGIFNKPTKIVQATPADVDIIRDIAADAFPKTYGDILSEEQIDYMMEMMYSHDKLVRDIQQDGFHYYIAFYRKEPVGYLSVQKQDTHTLYLDKIYIKPAMQKIGLGKDLIRKAEECGRQVCGKGAHLYLRVNKNNDAIGFYKHMGLTIEIEDKKDIGGGYYMDDFVMGKTL